VTNLSPETNLSAWLQWGAMVAGVGVALLVVSVLVWTGRDAASRTSSRALQLAAVLLVLFLNLLGLVIYVLLRSPETRSERREREIIEAILAREATGQLARPQA
jgi:ABC-type nickel/cobalt efflux system permease component RcnA